jgi:hypothetical protein
MNKLCFSFENFSLSDNRKRTFQYEDQETRQRSFKQICSMQISESYVGSQISPEEEIHLVKCGQPPRKWVQVSVSYGMVREGNRYALLIMFRQIRLKILMNSPKEAYDARWKFPANEDGRESKIKPSRKYVEYLPCGAFSVAPLIPFGESSVEDFLIMPSVCRMHDVPQRMEKKKISYWKYGWVGNISLVENVTHFNVFW